MSRSMRSNITKLQRLYPGDGAWSTPYHELHSMLHMQANSPLYPLEWAINTYAEHLLAHSVIWTPVYPSFIHPKI